MNTIQVLKKCIQIDFFEYTFLMNTLDYGCHECPHFKQVILTLPLPRKPPNNPTPPNNTPPTSALPSPKPFLFAVSCFEPQRGHLISSSITYLLSTNSDAIYKYVPL